MHIEEGRKLKQLIKKLFSTRSFFTVNTGSVWKPPKGERNKMTKKMTNNAGAPVADNQNAMTAGPRGPMLLQDVWFLEKLAHFDGKVIPERRMHAKGSGAYSTFTVTHDITKYTKAKIFSEVGSGATTIRLTLQNTGRTDVAGLPETGGTIR
jgi:hypothetical protein